MAQWHLLLVAKAMTSSIDDGHNRESVYVGSIVFIRCLKRMHIVWYGMVWTELVAMVL
jgi:hypothetical protein